MKSGRIWRLSRAGDGEEESRARRLEENSSDCT